MTIMPDGTMRASGLRDSRYAEIFLITAEGNRLKAAVYNTTGLNDCPIGKWQSLDAERLAKEFDVPAVYLNGPRFWTLDQLTAYAVGATLSFDGLEARLVGELYIPPAMDLTSHESGRYYSDAMIKRQTEWLFKAGRPVHELLAPDGKTYVMQAYSHLVDDGLTMGSLRTLGDRLHLPAGWQYRVATPDQDLTMRPAAGQAHVLQDELENTYMQLVTT